MNLLILDFNVTCNLLSNPFSNLSHVLFLCSEVFTLIECSCELDESIVVSFSPLWHDDPGCNVDCFVSKCIVPCDNDCIVTNLETGKAAGIYDMAKLTSPDLYDVYLSGAVSLMTIDNPNAPDQKELIVFRDSFGSSLVPLLAQSYSRITLVDIRYVSSQMLDSFLTFDNQDVLFLYSTLILNNSATLK